MTKITMQGLSIGIAIALTATSATADPTVEVMHFWTSGGEAAALSAIRDEVVANGVGWEDAPVAGGGGDAARTVMQARIAAGDPPTAMLMLGQNIIDWADAGMLGDVNSVAASEGWSDVLPDAVRAFTEIDGRYVSAPTNVHRTDMIWASRAAFEAIDADIPTTWDEFNALAPQFLDAGIIPIAHGGQSWQELYMFEAVLLGVAGAEFYDQALVQLSDDALNSSTMIDVFEQLAIIRDSMIDENAVGRDWNLATSMVINGQAAMQIMGDWAKGEFTNAGLTAGDEFICFQVLRSEETGFIYVVNSLTFFEQEDAENAAAQAVLASAIMNPEVQIQFNLAKGSIPARNDLDLSDLDACAQSTAADFAEANAAGTAVPTFAGSHAASAAVVGGATDAITEFFNSDLTSEEGAALLAEVIAFNL
ncbi:sugar ABC transporter substrate-binding protein [Jannaschia sp. EhC01]|nr:sugar ABC transporter substrate-binding protein [Jannaschia sp. EhC01]